MAKEDQNEEELNVIELEENLADVEKPKELPPGNYIGEVNNVTAKTDKNGAPYFAIQFTVPTDRIPADMQDEYPDGAQLFLNYLRSPTRGADARAKWRFKQFILALGLKADGSTFDPNDWMGRECRLIVAMGKGQDGEPRAEIKGFAAGEAPAAQKNNKRGARK